MISINVKVPGTGTARCGPTQERATDRRTAAQGLGFMAYGVAMARLRLALIPMLQSGRAIGGVFDEVFR